MPFRKHDTDAGWDLFADRISFDEDGNVVYHLGVGMEIPEGYVGLIFPRSSVSKTELSLSNAVAVIDCGFTGEITVKFKPSRSYVANDYAYEPMNPERYDVGDRVCQIIVMPYPSIEWDEVEELTKSDRGSGGYGSTGK